MPFTFFNIINRKASLLCGFKELKKYKKLLTKPLTTVSKKSITREWDNVQRIIASLLLGETAEFRHQQSMILAKLYNDRIRGKKMADITPITRAELESLIRVVPEGGSRFAFR